MQNKKPDDNKPFPVRLGALKPIIAEIAHDEKESLHKTVLTLLRERLRQKKKIA